MMVPSQPALARLSLSAEELERVGVDLDRILEYVELLEGVDTSEVEPTSHVIPLATPLREDRPEPPLDPETAVANAPEHTESAFVLKGQYRAMENGSEIFVKPVNQEISRF